MRAAWFLVLLAIFPTLGYGKSRSHHHLRLRRPHFRHARRINFNSPLRGNRESLLRQNERIDENNLPRIKDKAELEQLEASSELVPLPQGGAVRVAGNLPPERRYCRPWTREFLLDLGEESYTQFGRGIQVNSAVRTMEVQHKLIRRNRNAAAETGELASPHLSGATVDIAKRGMSRKQLAWVRTYLLSVQSRGLADVEEEFRQSVFHITVYPEYSGDSRQLAKHEPPPPPVLPEPAQHDLTWPDLVAPNPAPPQLAQPEPASISPAE